MKSITDAEFESEVLKSGVPVVVKAYASWCPPCRTLGVILDKLAPEFEPRLKLVKMNIDETNTHKAYNLSAIPTLLLFKDGELKDKIVGLLSEGALRQSFEDLLKSV